MEFKFIVAVPFKTHFYTPCAGLTQIMLSEQHTIFLLSPTLYTTSAIPKKTPEFVQTQDIKTSKINKNRKYLSIHDDDGRGK